jgi:hypothetical protein
MKDFLEFIRDYPASVTIPAIFFTIIGIFIGNRLAIGRDKRIEWNNLIEPIRDNLIRSLRQPGIDVGLSEAKITDIRSHLSFF